MKDKPTFRGKKAFEGLADFDVKESIKQLTRDHKGICNEYYKYTVDDTTNHKEIMKTVINSTNNTDTSNNKKNNTNNNKNTTTLNNKNKGQN